MRRLTHTLPLAGLLLAAACSEQSGMAPDAARNGATVREPGAVTVMSRNLYVGADLDRVLGALVSPDPNDDLQAILGGIQELTATDYPSRVKALAGEIERYRPQVVGLQEVWAIDIDLTPLGVPVVIHQDFLPLLMAELQARGLNYSAATVVTESQASPIPGISLVDHDAILVDGGSVTVSNVLPGASFQANIGPVAPGVSLVRGWTGLEVSIDGRPYTVINTHLESGGSGQIPLLRAAQAQELLAHIPSSNPVFMTGDFNDSPGSPMYQVVTQAGGFTDLWDALRPEAPGLTCCHLSDLSNQVETFKERIDFVFVRALPGRRVFGQVRRIGAEPEAKLAGPFFRIWPSDHAGVVGDIGVN
jgi:endonuclease/exonuclease/phosphatase family protein